MTAPLDNTFERWPAPPRRTVRSGLEGLEILGEATPPLAGLLWTAYRFVTLWTEAPRAVRPELADAGAERRWVAEVVAAGLPGEVEEPLLALAVVLRQPVEANPTAVGLALRALVQRCWEAGWRESAALIAESAARTVPGDAGAVYEAGRAARRAGWEREAEAWFRHGLSLARRRRSGRDASLFLGSLGNGALRRGNLRLAERLHLRALRAARRSSAHERAAGAMHDLFVVALRRGDARTAERWAAAALEGYGAEHASTPVLIHDLAYHWMDRGDFADAYPLMAALLPHLRPEDGHMRVGVLANLARAAAGVGDRSAFESAWSQVVRAWSDRSEAPGWAATLAVALTEAAQGALHLGEATRAIWAVEQAEPLARSAGLGRERLVLDAVREAAERALRSPVPAAPAAAGAPQPERGQLAGQCLALLQSRAVPV
jgi:hypothetical protein